MPLKPAPTAMAAIGALSDLGAEFLNPAIDGGRVEDDRTLSQ
ncbi:hypothetical protein C357_20782 [Citreicella sp. 357]|nr:hypothetical protein C357_20782 [Citreicella sp. 357]